MDMLTISPERIRRALWRSFLRHGVTGEIDVAVHAAMNIVGPVLAARDAEITRLHETLGRVPAQPPARSARARAAGRPRSSAARSRTGAARAQPPARPRAAATRADGPVLATASRVVLAGARSSSGRLKRQAAAPQPASP